MADKRVYRPAIDTEDVSRQETPVTSNRSSSFEPLLELTTRSVANLRLFEAFIPPSFESELETMTSIVNNLMLHACSGTCSIHSSGRIFQQIKKIWLHLTVYQSDDREISITEVGFVCRLLEELCEMLNSFDQGHSEMIEVIKKLCDMRLQL